MSILNDIYDKVKEISEKVYQMYAVNEQPKVQEPQQEPIDQNTNETMEQQKPDDKDADTNNSIKDLNLGTLFSGVQKATGMFVKLLGMLQTQTMEKVIDEPYTAFKQQILSYDAPINTLGSTEDENRRISKQMSETFARFQNTAYVNQTAFMNVAAESSALSAPGYKPDVIQKNINDIFFTIKSDDISTLKSYAEQLSKASKNFQLYPNGR